MLDVKKRSSRSGVGVGWHLLTSSIPIVTYLCFLSLNF